MLLRPPFLARGLLSRDPPPSPGDVLSPEVEQRCRETLRGTLLPPTASAGVLVTLCSSEGVPTFLYTLRSPQLRGRHKGDVSFPGGKRDEWDRDIVHTALREAQEELGVTLTPDVVWGAMKPLTDWAGMVIVPVLAYLGPLETLSPNPNPEEAGMVIVPVLAYLGPLETLSPNPNPEEVESLLTLPLSHACTDSSRGYTCFRRRGRYSHTLPVFQLPGYKVWGLTAMMTDSALSLLLPSSYRSALHRAGAR
ncbi:mitochondrial coenzyme A diphosphatase NUDT8 isoform X1 [Ascaphus truei]|uniref:mitochondrial coenzyme A diphosphatase NUDT8 isoform X1 n=1 Tax=Ascaphus truei TaxID=8439 RepID=UPI003F5A5BBD